MKLAAGSVFVPETIKLLTTVLDEAWAALLPEQQNYTKKIVLAERILGLAARGERDPIRLRNGAVAPKRGKTLQSSSEKLMTEIFIYREHRIEVKPSRRHWRARIYPQGSIVALAENPTLLKTAPKRAIVAEAKNAIDAHFEAEKMK